MWTNHERKDRRSPGRAHIPAIRPSSERQVANRPGPAAESAVSTLSMVRFSPVMIHEFDLVVATWTEGRKPRASGGLAARRIVRGGSAVVGQGAIGVRCSVGVARNADTEILFDRPYADNKIVRVAGPFTVESLSPHRVVADGPEDLVNAAAPIEDSGRFVETILDNLRASGVDNRTKGERLRFETLDPYPGRFLQATGTFREGETDRRVAVAIGPQYGTVGPDLVREAALETGGYFDVLVVCGFAFDALADEAGGKAMRFGKLTVLTARMNPDLAMAEELLKKTRTGNLFTVFGQPDIAIRPMAGGSGGAGDLQVEIHGLDVYDPTTGVVRSDSTDDIACWFIDTAYDDQQFFVRHAYFLGADDPYDKLKRALRADIDEAAWASLNSTVSRPFARPASGRIAVKVINHYGDEILKVYGV